MSQICLSTDKYFFYAKLNNKFNRYFRIKLRSLESKPFKDLS